MPPKSIERFRAELSGPDDLPELTPAQEKAVAAMLTAGSLEEAARLAGVDVSTLRRWRRLPQFRIALRAGKEQLLGATMNELRELAPLAVAGLKKILLSPTAPATAICSAARVVFETLQQGRENDIDEDGRIVTENMSEMI
jgi:transposase-like protein